MKILYSIFFLAISFSILGQGSNDTTKNKTERLKPINELTQKPLVFFKKIKKPKHFLKRTVFGSVNPLENAWADVNRFGIDLSEVALVNWNSGGGSSVSGIINADVKRNYKKGKIKWRNELLAKYGVNKQEEQKLRKTDDKLEINSNFGYRKDTLSNWYYSARLGFTTQFSNGYNYPDVSNKLSTIMAPAYLFFGAGSEYGAVIDNFQIYASPITLKSTFVLDQELANKGAFGVEPAVTDMEGKILKEGENIRMQVGILLSNEYQAEIVENIALSNKLSLYTDYLNKFGNVDVNWEVDFNFKVNDYVLAKLGSHLKYDDDVKTLQENNIGETVEKGPKVQWKQQLGIGVIVEL